MESDESLHNSTELTNGVIDELSGSSVIVYCSFLNAEELRRSEAEIGFRVIVQPGVTVDFPEKLVVGDDVEIGAGVFIQGCWRGVTIGDRLIVEPGGPSVPKVSSGVRPIFGLGPIRCSEILHDVSVGLKAILMPSIYVGSGAVVSLGAVLINNLPDSKFLNILTSTQSKNRSEA